MDHHDTVISKQNNLQSPGYPLLIGTLDRRNTSIRLLNSQLFWLLFVPTFVFFFFVLCQWLLVIILVATGLCWWPLLLVASSGFAHVIGALVFVRFKTIGRESVAFSTQLATLVIVVAFILYLLCVALEAPAQCFSASFKEKLIISTSNASISINSIVADSKHHLSLLFPLYRELAVFICHKSEQNPLWYSTLYTSRDRSAKPQYTLVVSDESIELAIFAFSFVDLLVKASDICVLVLETSAAFLPQVRSRPGFSSVF